MLDDSFAPIKRAGLFFGVMGVAVAAMTYGASLQAVTDQSSTSVEQARIEQRLPADARFAAVDPTAKARSVSQRAVSPSQQALLPSDGRLTR